MDVFKYSNGLNIVIDSLTQDLDSCKAFLAYTQSIVQDVLTYDKSHSQIPNQVRTDVTFYRL